MATILSQRKLDPKKIEEKLRQFGSDNKCPISGHYSWAIADEFVSVVPWSGKNRNFLFNNTYPAVMLACERGIPFNVRLPESLSFIGITDEQWNQLKRQVENIGPSENLWFLVCSVSLTLGISFLISVTQLGDCGVLDKN